jgi:hypothetical protein
MSLYSTRPQARIHLIGLSPAVLGMTRLQVKPNGMVRNGREHRYQSAAGYVALSADQAAIWIGLLGCEARVIAQLAAHDQNSLALCIETRPAERY